MNFIKYSILLLLVVVFSCDALDDLGDNESSIVHFRISPNSSRTFAKITVNGNTKSISQLDDLDYCNGGDYAGLATYTSSSSSMNYIVKDLNGQQISSGSVKLSAKCTDYVFE
jgi:hypothetical protein